MADESTTQIPALLQKAKSGDEQARNQLISIIYDEMSDFARARLHLAFPRLENLHSTATVVHKALQKLITALQSATIESPEHFLAIAKQQVRWTLLSLAEQADRLPSPLSLDIASEETDSPGIEVADTTQGPEDRAERKEWIDYLHKMEKELPPELQQVVELCLHSGLTQAEAAELLKVHRNTIQTRLLKAKMILGAAFKDET